MSRSTVEWRAICGFAGYEVSSAGLVRSLKKRVPRVLSVEVDKDGYRRVQLFKDGRYFHRFVHRLVADAFLPRPTSDRLLVCHNDGSRSNNTPANLRWGTQKENVADKRAHGTQQIGSKHPRSKIDEAKAAEIKARLSCGDTLLEAALAVGTTRHVVADISRGRTWNHVAS